MNIKRYRIALVCIIVLVIISTIFAVYFYYSNKQSENSSIKQTEIAPQEYQYYLKEYNNQIGVYRYSEDEPFQTIDVYTFNLPSVDQEHLKEGIMVQDDEKLSKIIEDYES